MELKNKVLELLKRHSSLLILAIASFSFFITNILLKEYLNAENYGLYSIFITYISIISSFGMLGFEQVLIRNSEIFNDKIYVSKKLKIPIIISVCLTSFLGSYLFLDNFNISLPIFYLSLITILVITIKLVYNLFRLLSNFVYSQLTLNFWKFCLFFVLIIFILNEHKIEISDITLIIFSSLVLKMFMIIILVKKVEFKSSLSINRMFRQSSLFLLSLVTITLINYGDRFFIESRFGLEELGNYFFLINLFLYPFSLFQSYVGFKEIVSFKMSYHRDILVFKLKQIFIRSILFGFFLVTTAYFIDFFAIYNFNFYENFNLILLLISLGIIKMTYSLLSSALGAICNNIMLYKTNVYSIISVLILSPLIYYYSFTITITMLFLIALWLIRCAIWYNQLLSFED